MMPNDLLHFNDEYISFNYPNYIKKRESGVPGEYFFSEKSPKRELRRIKAAFRSGILPDYITNDSLLVKILRPGEEWFVLQLFSNPLPSSVAGSIEAEVVLTGPTIIRLQAQEYAVVIRNAHHNVLEYSWELLFYERDTPVYIKISGSGEFALTKEMWASVITSIVLKKLLP